MTIASTARKAGPLLGTGTQTTFPFTFKVFAGGDLLVTRANALGIETALVLDVDYTVTLNSNQETSPGGTVTYPISGAALPVGSVLAIVGDLDYDQPLDLPSGGNFSPLALENQLDRATMQIQQLNERLDRTFSLPVSSSADSAVPAPTAGYVIGWDALGERLTNLPAAVGTSLIDLAAPSGASLVGFSWDALPSAVNKVDWGIQTAASGVSVLRYIPPAEWPAIFAGTSTYDCYDALVAALAAHNSVYVPEGLFNTATQIDIPQRKSLNGCGYGSRINAIGVTGSVISLAALNGPSGASGLRITGNATVGLTVNNCQLLKVDNITLDGLTATNGFVFKSTWGSSFRDLRTNGATISRANFEFLDEVNSCVFDNLYTSNISEYNFLYNGTGHGNTFNTPTAQGGRFGFYVRTSGGFGGIVVNSLYVENCAKPIVLGEAGSAKTTQARGIVFNGAMLGGPVAEHANYLDCVAAIELNSCRGVKFNGTLFLGLSKNAGGFPTVTITGDGSGAYAIPIVKPTGEINSICVLTPGTGYTSATAEISGGGGSGATLTVTIATGGIGAINVTAGGAGYKRTQTPVAAVFDSAWDVEFSASAVFGTALGSNIPLYPFLVKKTGASQFASTISIDDVSLRRVSYGASAKVMKMGVAGADFAIQEFGVAGAQTISVYLAPNYP